MKPAYLVILSGQGDTSVALVEPDIWEWIASPPPDTERFRVNYGDYDPLTPEKVRQANAQSLFRRNDDEDGTPEHRVFVTSGSWENDRAMSLSEGLLALLCLWRHGRYSCSRSVGTG